MTSNLTEELIGYGATWCPTTNGFYVQYEPDTSSFVSDEQLVAVNPNLPDAIRILSIRESFSGVGSGSIHELLKLWNAAVHVVDCMGRCIAVNDVFSIHIEDGLVFFNCDSMMYTEKRLADKSPVFKIPNGTTIQDLIVNVSWLDTNHPGWLERFEVAQTLDCDSIDTVKYMMSSANTMNGYNLPSDITP